MIALLLLAALPRCGDSFHLRYEAARAGLPPTRVEAIARAESACNLDPRLLGHACRWAPRSCDRGRFQIRPVIARGLCPGLRVSVYQENVLCALWILKASTARHGLTNATLWFNGRSVCAQYLRRVLEIEEGL